MLQISKGICLALLAAALLVIAPVNSRFAQAAEDTELMKQMEAMQDHLKKLRKSIKDPKENAASLETLTKFQEATVISKQQVPARAAMVPEAERPKFIAAYRKDMAALLEHLCKIEVAILDGDNAKAEELFKGLKKIEDDGHEKYSNE
jgi:soluble cytochrome b562